MPPKPIHKLFLSTGVMKAGTTWLYSVLKHHPEIYFCPEKEIHFWSDYNLKTSYLSPENRFKKVKQKIAVAQTSGNVKEYKKILRWSLNYLKSDLTIDWYKNLFVNNRNENRYNADFSNVTCHINAKGWEEVKEACNQLKVIYILRDPYKRLWSHIKFHHQYSGKEINFGEWSEKTFSDFISRKFIWINCEYSTWIKSMQTSLDNNQFKLFYFEDFINTPFEILVEVEDFLQINHHQFNKNHVNKQVNPSKEIAMPLNFLNAAKPIISKEMEKLETLNTLIHPLWNL